MGEIAFLPLQTDIDTIHDNSASSPSNKYDQKHGNLLRKLSVQILTTLEQSNDQAVYHESLNPKRILTAPSKGIYNGGCDNEHHDYILIVNESLGPNSRFVVLDFLGHGTFGQVVKCWDVENQESVAIKIVKNQASYFDQSIMEIAVLEWLNQRLDASSHVQITRMKDKFVHKQHLCIVFELLSLNLFELIKQNNFKGIPHSLIRIFLNQILDALIALKTVHIVHCDLKPENILLKTTSCPEIRLIDFGSACHEQHPLYTYVQSRFYRSPEVLLGMVHSSSIDMWSLGCVAAELFLGLPLFPGSSNYDQVSRIVHTLGMPPFHLIERGNRSHQYFEQFGTEKDGKPLYRLKSLDQYNIENNTNRAPSKRYFEFDRLNDIIAFHPLRKTAQASIELELYDRRVFLDFLKGLLRMDAAERWTPSQAKMHPYITGEGWTGPFAPPIETDKQNTRTDPREILRLYSQMHKQFKIQYPLQKGSESLHGKKVPNLFDNRLEF